MEYGAHIPEQVSIYLDIYIAVNLSARLYVNKRGASKYVPTWVPAEVLLLQLMRTVDTYNTPSHSEVSDLVSIVTSNNV